MRTRSWLLALALLLASATPSRAHEFVFTAPFAPEGGPGATGSGTAIVTFDVDVFTMRVQATWSGTSGTSTAAHIHCCTTSPGTGDAGVPTQVPSFAGFPLGVTGGTYDRTFAMNLASSWNPAFSSAQGGINGAFNTLGVGLQNDRGYLDIHTNTFPSGEIRASLEEGHPVTGPGTWHLLAAGLATLVLARRQLPGSVRRRRA